MRYLIAFCLSFTLLTSYTKGLNRSGKEINLQSISETNSGTDSLPSVFSQNHADIVGTRLKNEAYLRFMKSDIPATLSELGRYKTRLKSEIIKKAGITADHNLLLDYHEAGFVKMDRFTIKNIWFQTLPGVYATANLYIPDGKGPFPAVLNSNGHWPGARLCEQVQTVAQKLASNGYVVLCIDAFGTGERSTIHGTSEYHGANSGLSLINIGKSLMGIQVSENMRGVDLLCSFPFVDSKNIGATGASGGGNQTMWITALDERIKAGVPVVSVGNFESYIMESNCVCELLIDGLTMTEESGILAMIAPRAFLILNHNQDSNPTFSPTEMLRTYTNIRPIFEKSGVRENLDYKLFDLIHDYALEDRVAMLDWFNLHLKGIANGVSSEEVSFKKIPKEKLMVFPSGQRDQKVKTIQDYCKIKGNELRRNLLSSRVINIELKKNELKKILRIDLKPVLKSIHQYSDQLGWKRFSLESDDGQLIPVLVIAPTEKSQGFTVLSDPKGKNGISLIKIDELKRKGSGIVIVDLFGTGEASSAKANSFDQSLARFHTLSRAELWLGRTVLGEWVNDFDLVTQFMKQKYGTSHMNIDANRETGLAALYYSLFQSDKVNSVTIREAPVSYVFDGCEGINFFSMGIHLPQFLIWGDVSLAAALSGKNISFINPVTMSGNAVTGNRITEINNEFKKMRRLCRRPGKTLFK